MVVGAEREIAREKSILGYELEDETKFGVPGDRNGNDGKRQGPGVYFIWSFCSDLTFVS